MVVFLCCPTFWGYPVGATRKSESDVARLLQWFLMDSKGPVRPWSTVVTFAVVLNGETETALPPAVSQALDNQVVLFNIFDPGPPPLRLISNFVSAIQFWLQKAPDHVALVYTPLTDHPSYVLLLTALSIALGGSAEGDLGVQATTDRLSRLTTTPHPMRMLPSVQSGFAHQSLPPGKLHASDLAYLQGFNNLCLEQGAQIESLSVYPQSATLSNCPVAGRQVRLEVYQVAFLPLKEGRAEVKTATKGLTKGSTKGPAKKSAFENPRMLDLQGFRR